MAEARAWLADAAEAEAVARLLIEFRDWYGRRDPPDDAFLDGVRRLIACDDTDYLLAGTDGDEPGGVCQLRYRYAVWMAADDCWLEDLFVREHHRGKGLGEALVAKAIARARERGCGRVELDVSESNRVAWALYERMGFSPDYKPAAPNVLMGLKLR